jgi:hypothetical protein
VLRRLARVRTTFAAAQAPRAPDGDGARQRRATAVRWCVLLPLALAAAAIAGAVFLVLLPICGIASGAEGVARWCWQAVRDAVSQEGRDIASQQ